MDDPTGLAYFEDLARTLASAGITAHRKMLAGDEFLVLERPIPEGGFRRVRIDSRVDEGLQEKLLSQCNFPGCVEKAVHAVLLTQYGSPNAKRNTDGRSWGPADFTARVIKLWLVDLVDIQALPRG